MKNKIKASTIVNIPKSNIIKDDIPKEPFETVYNIENYYEIIPNTLYEKAFNLDNKLNNPQNPGYANKIICDITDIELRERDKRIEELETKYEALLKISRLLSDQIQDMEQAVLDVNPGWSGLAQEYYNKQ